MTSLKHMSLVLILVLLSSFISIQLFPIVTNTTETIIITPEVIEPKISIHNYLDDSITGTVNFIQLNNSNYPQLFDNQSHQFEISWTTDLNVNPYILITLSVVNIYDYPTLKSLGEFSHKNGSMIMNDIDTQSVVQIRIFIVISTLAYAYYNSLVGGYGNFYFDIYF